MRPKRISRVHLLLNRQKSLIFISPETLLPIRFQAIRLVQIRTTPRRNIAPLLHRAIRKRRARGIDRRDGRFRIDAHTGNDVVYGIPPRGVHGVVGVAMLNAMSV
jgi:hypothetical protein